MKNKVIFSFLLLFVVCFSIGYVSADTIDVSQIKISPDIVPEGYKDLLSNGYVSVYNVLNNSSFLLILNDSTGKFYGNKSGSDYIRYIGSTVSCAYFTYNNSTGTYTLSKSSMGPSNALCELTWTGDTPNINDNNVPIYTDNTGSDVFFQPPAQVGILTQVLEKEIQNNPKLVLNQIAKILIPILVAVVFFLGFRKAWKILRTSLNNA